MMDEDNKDGVAFKRFEHWRVPVLSDLPGYKPAPASGPPVNYVARYSKRYGWHSAALRAGVPSSAAPLARGGYTACRLYDDAGEVIAVGVSLCSMADAFSYKMGRRIAEGRARAALLRAQRKKMRPSTAAEAVQAFADVFGKVLGTEQTATDRQEVGHGND